jgi:hypothetical protein
MLISNFHELWRESSMSPGNNESRLDAASTISEGTTRKAKRLAAAMTNLSDRERFERIASDYRREIDDKCD